MRWSGHHRQKRLPCSLPGKIHPKSMARGSALESQDERLVALPQMLLPMPGGRQAPLPSRGQPVVERACGKKMRSPNGPSTSHIRLIVSTVLCGSSAWHQGLKEIGRVASVQFAVCYLLLPPLSKNPSFSDQYGGWMWKVERFAASGQPIGVGNTWRSFPWFRPSNRCCLLPTPLVPFVLIAAGVGRIDSPAMPGGDHRNCVSASLAFLLV